MFIARAPAEASDAKGFEVVEAIFPLETEHPFKGVNVHSASESLAVLQLRDTLKTMAASEDCSKCVGKLLVAKGTPYPQANRLRSSSARKTLPAGTRIVRHSEGIPRAESNPNRLTLIVNKEGRDQIGRVGVNTRIVPRPTSDAGLIRGSSARDS